MTKQEFKQIIEAIKKVREILTPDQAAQVPFLFQNLENVDRDIQQGEKFRDGNTVFEAKQPITKKELKEAEHVKKPEKKQHEAGPTPWQKVEPNKTPKEKPQPPHKK